MADRTKRKYVHSVYLGKMFDRDEILIAVYAGKHRVRAPAFCTSRDGGHVVYRDSYAGGGLYITTAGNIKWPSYRYSSKSWPGLYQRNLGSRIQILVQRSFDLQSEAFEYEKWLIGELHRHYPKLCCNLDLPFRENSGNITNNQETE